MQFSESAIKEKINSLDAINSSKESLYKVLRRNYKNRFKAVPIRRAWEPGGGSSLFKIVSCNEQHFLKVKSKVALVESKLEAEEEYICIPSLQNEFQILQILQGLPEIRENIPKVIFFEELDGFQFLAFEWLDTFISKVIERSHKDILCDFEQIERVVAFLFNKSIIHTDLHENNLCYRADTIVIVDFEEARKFTQNTTFEDSLDFAGSNAYGDLGDAPVLYSENTFRKPCLLRLRKTFELLIQNDIQRNIAKYKYDNNVGINHDILQAQDNRIYQSIALPGKIIEGQRPIKDSRIPALRTIVKYFTRTTEITHVDIGSNLGSFCFEIAKLNSVRKSIGVEGTPDYISLSNSLRFLHKSIKTEFIQLICGEDELSLPKEDVYIFTLFSVYHHITNKNKLLKEMRYYTIDAIIIEFATQKRYYPERGDWSAEVDFIKKILNFRYTTKIGNSIDYKRSIILFSNRSLSPITLIQARIALSKPLSRFKQIIVRKLVSLMRQKQHE